MSSSSFQNGLRGFMDLKPVSKAFIGSLLLVLILFIVYHWQMFFCSLILLLPSMRLFHWWVRSGYSIVSIDHLLSSYAQGFWILMCMATGLGFISLVVASLLLAVILGAMFGFSTFEGWCWIFELGRWFVFVFVEEVLKASFVRYDRIRRQKSVGSEAKSHAISALSLSLGYATSQSFLFMVIVTSILANNGGVNAQREQKIKGSEFGWLIFWSLFFGLVTMPLNLMGTYLMGVAITKAGEDSGECCCVPHCPNNNMLCCDCNNCGYPPGGCNGIRAFLYVLKYPLILRTLLIAQFFCWFYWLPIVWAFFCQTFTITAIYFFAYHIVKKASEDPMADDVYRQVYGFQLLNDDGEMPGSSLPRPPVNDGALPLYNQNNSSSANQSSAGFIPPSVEMSSPPASSSSSSSVSTSTSSSSPATSVSMVKKMDSNLDSVSPNSTTTVSPLVQLNDEESAQDLSGDEEEEISLSRS